MDSSAPNRPPTSNAKTTSLKRRAAMGRACGSALPRLCLGRHQQRAKRSATGLAGSRIDRNLGTLPQRQAAGKHSDVAGIRQRDISVHGTETLVAALALPSQQITSSRWPTAPASTDRLVMAAGEGRRGRSWKREAGRRGSSGKAVPRT